jgi:hypothetical protein
MFGATEQSHGLNGSSQADHTPTLAPAPEGLSARRVERWLDLPPGAWQRRRLYALRLRGEAFASLGFREGDLVIVEPGARERPGKTVITRSATNLGLKRIPLPPQHDGRMPNVLELPLRPRTLDGSERVVGTVIGLLRSTGTGALRPVSLSRPRSRPASGHSGARLPEVPSSERRADEAKISVETLRTALTEWRSWIVRASDARRASSPALPLDRWERLEASFATLCDCLAHTHNPRLQAALLEEAAMLLDEIGSEMGG